MIALLIVGCIITYFVIGLCVVIVGWVIFSSYETSEGKVLKWDSSIDTVPVAACTVFWPVALLLGLLFLLGKAVMAASWPTFRAFARAIGIVGVRDTRGYGDGNITYFKDKGKPYKKEKSK